MSGIRPACRTLKRSLTKLAYNAIKDALSVNLNDVVTDLVGDDKPSSLASQLTIDGETQSNATKQSIVVNALNKIVSKRFWAAKPIVFFIPTGAQGLQYSDWLGGVFGGLGTGNIDVDLRQIPTLSITQYYWLYDTPIASIDWEEVNGPRPQLRMSPDGTTVSIISKTPIDSSLSIDTTGVITGELTDNAYFNILLTSPKGKTASKSITINGVFTVFLERDLIIEINKDEPVIIDLHFLPYYTAVELYYWELPMGLRWDPLTNTIFGSANETGNFSTVVQFTVDHYLNLQSVRPHSDRNPADTVVINFVVRDVVSSNSSSGLGVGTNLI